MIRFYSILFDSIRFARRRAMGPTRPLGSGDASARTFPSLESLLGLSDIGALERCARSTRKVRSEHSTGARRAASALSLARAASVSLPTSTSTSTSDAAPSPWRVSVFGASSSPPRSSSSSPRRRPRSRGTTTPRDPEASSGIAPRARRRSTAATRTRARAASSPDRRRRASRVPSATRSARPRTRASARRARGTRRCVLCCNLQGTNVFHPPLGFNI